MSADNTLPKELIPYPLQVALRVTRVLEEFGIPYLLGGSMASSVHGEPRLTNDADLVADIKEPQISALVAALAEDFYIDEHAVRRAVRERKSCNVIYLATMFKVDIFVYSGDAWAHEQMRLRELRPLLAGDDATARYVSNPETTILQKLHWYRKGGEVADKQWGDVLGVFKIKRRLLDYDYLHHWAAELRITDLLDKALTAAGINPPPPPPPDTHNA